jgi:predicted TIM-barrel fold metal-dependent hydrolase
METISPPVVPAILQGFPIIDSDTHITEPHDLWTSRAPAKYKDRVPQIKPVNGQPHWVIDDDKVIGTDMGGSAVLRDGSKVGVDYMEKKIGDIHRGAYDVKARLAYMDETGITAQIAYPNLLGFGGSNAQVVKSDIRLVSTQIYNDAMAELQAQSGNRIFPMILVPWWDVKEAVAEIKRCYKMGMKGINTNSDPHSVPGLPDLSDPYWYPMWETCTELDLPVNFHIAASDISSSWFGSGAWPAITKDRSQQLAYGANMMFMTNIRVLINVIMSRFLEHFPTLKIVSVESGVGWIPTVLESLEYQSAENWLHHKVSPTEIFKRQIYVCGWFERRHFARHARMVGIDNVLFETDFPHPTCVYPDALHAFESTAAEFTPEERRKVFGGNAARVYNLQFS